MPVPAAAGRLPIVRDHLLRMLRIEWDWDEPGTYEVPTDEFFPLPAHDDWYLPECRRCLDEALREASADDWRGSCGIEQGSYSVIASWRHEESPAASMVIACHAGVLPNVADDLLRRIKHVGPETLLQGVSLDTAIRAKEDLTQMGWLKVAIKEKAPATTNGRKPIPESVRAEVWRRDEGQCVDCGSRERLEFDHIIPVSRGGSNTARNIELRCEACNRAKSDTI